MTALYATLAHYEQRARHALVRGLLDLLVLLLNARTIIHALLVLHLGWEAGKMAMSGDELQLDPRQYAYMISHGGEHAWMWTLATGAAAGLVGLLMSSMPARLLGAFALGTVEFALNHAITSSGAAPTAGPTYSVLEMMAAWLMIANWFRDTRLVRR